MHENVTSEAESGGLVHRDIKPANIFVCRYGEDRDFIKVLDFGLVKAFDEAVERGLALTRENVGHGIPAFIAPEQVSIELASHWTEERLDCGGTGISRTQTGHWWRARGPRRQERTAVSATRELRAIGGPSGCWRRGVKAIAYR